MFERDDKLDKLRSLAMMWVIVVHGIYWTGIFAEGVLHSFLLIEMPLIFLVTGASNLYSRQKNYIQFVFARVKRILIPYWVYAILVCVINVDQGYSYKGMLQSFFLLSGYSGYASTCWALWFIPVYIHIILLFPLLKRYYLKYENNAMVYIPGLLFIGGVYVCEKFNALVYIRYIFFYGFFTYLGCFWKRLSRRRGRYKNIIAIFAFLCGIYGMSVLYHNGLYGLDMQINKFPPNMMFLIFALSGMMLIYLFYNYIYKILNLRIFSKVIEIYSRYSYSIFLYQPLAFIAWPVLISTYGLTWIYQMPGIFQLIITLIFLIPFCALLGSVFGRIEDKCR